MFTCLSVRCFPLFLICNFAILCNRVHCVHRVCIVMMHWCSVMHCFFAMLGNSNEMNYVALPPVCWHVCRSTFCSFRFCCPRHHHQQHYHQVAIYVDLWHWQTGKRLARTSFHSHPSSILFLIPQPSALLGIHTVVLNPRPRSSILGSLNLSLQSSALLILQFSVLVPQS